MYVADSLTSWSFDCPTDAGSMPPPGGIVLQKLTHDGHNFAKDIRVVGVWIETEVVEPSGAVTSSAKKLYLLNSSTFAVTPVEVLSPVTVRSPVSRNTFEYLKGSDAALDFGQYFTEGTANYFASGVRSTFTAPALMASYPNCVHSGIALEQIFLFSRYGSSPKHEPSGGLSAARFHPMVRYSFSANPTHDPKRTFTRVSSVRFDYRLHLYLDRHYDAATNATLAQLGNQAGIFADSDTALGTVGAAVGSFIWNIREKNTKATAVTSGSFDAVEKPLVLEVTAPGLAKGFSVFSTKTAGGTPLNVRCWDNLHWWGSKGLGAPLISTPGAFHCAHLHWRWGAAAKAAPGVSGDPRFNPRTWPAGMPVHPAIAGMWGPLVDPAIWIQSIRVAVTKNDSRLDPARVAATELTKADWKSLFDPGLRAAPLDIYNGDDIVLWYSAEVHREVTVPTSSASAMPPSFSVPPPPTYTTAAGGTVFIHGFFFAHDAEKTGLAVGSVDPAHKPISAAAIRAGASWFRSAR